MFQTIFVQPIYNLFIFILGFVPGGDVGIGIVFLTLLIRAVLYPLFTSSIRTQMAMQAVQPEMAEISERYKNDPAQLRQRQAELFQRHRIKFSSIFGSLAIQIVVFFALSYVFRLGLLTVRTDLLYSFIHAPAHLSETFLGLINLTETHNIFLAVFVALLQFAAMWLTLSRTSKAGSHLSPEQRRAQELQRQMTQYTLPIFMGAIVFISAGGIGIYFAVSNLVSIVQEWLLRRKPL